MAWLLPTGNRINLQLGWPSQALFPADALRRGADEVLSDAAAAGAALIYGPNPGAPALRAAIARWLGSVYGRAVDPARVCVAGGASQNLSNILLRFADPAVTRRVWMVEPTYFLACPVFEDCGFAGKLRGVPEDDEGVDLEFLRAGMEAAEAEAAAADPPQTPLKPNNPKIYKHIIYTVPTFSNPSGKTMSLGHREALVRLAIEFDALIVSDDVYDVLRWAAGETTASSTSTPSAAATSTATTPTPSQLLPVPPRLVDIDARLDPGSQWGHTVSNGSFSKIIAPGARVSWSESTPAFAAFLANTGATWSGGNPAHMTSSFVERMLASGALEAHIRDTLVPTYRARYRALVDAVRAHLEPLGVRITSGRPYYVTDPAAGPDGPPVELAGGFFLCVSVPPRYPPAAVLAQRALDDQELKVAHGRMFGVRGDPASLQRADAPDGYARIFRLCWSFHDEATIRAGVERLRDVLVASQM